jgi:hypothetical protein
MFIRNRVAKPEWDTLYIIKVTESSHHAVDLLVDSYPLSLNSREPWICYDLKKMMVKPTHYAIRSRHDAGPGATHPKSWVIEGATWIGLHHKKNSRDLMFASWEIFGTLFEDVND